MKTKLIIIALLLVSSLTTINAQKYKAEVPDYIKMPDVVHTELLGDLNFFDGLPSLS